MREIKDPYLMYYTLLKDIVEKYPKQETDLVLWESHKGPMCIHNSKLTKAQKKKAKKDRRKQ